MRRRLTITVDEEVYDGLHRIVGRRKISGFRTELARPHVVSGDLSTSARRSNGSKGWLPTCETNPAEPRRGGPTDGA